MATAQEQYDDAMYAFSTGDFDGSITRLKALLDAIPDHFEARLALGMAHCRKGDFAQAIHEGHKAEQLRPKEALVHTNLSLFYLKAGDKVKAEHHGLQARIASWRREESAPLADRPDSELVLAKPAGATPPVPTQFPEMPWKKKSGVATPTKSTSPVPSKDHP